MVSAITLGYKGFNHTFAAIHLDIQSFKIMLYSTAVCSTRLGEVCLTLALVSGARLHRQKCAHPPIDAKLGTARHQSLGM